MNELIRADQNINLVQAAATQQRIKAELAEKMAKTPNMPQIEQAAQEFESVFLAEMLKPMFKDVNEPDPTFGGGHGEEVFNGILVQEYGKIMAENGGIGIADHVRAELIKIQESRNGAVTAATEEIE